MTFKSLRRLQNAGRLPNFGSLQHFGRTENFGRLPKNDFGRLPKNNLGGSQKFGRKNRMIFLESKIGAVIPGNSNRFVGISGN